MKAAGRAGYDSADPGVIQQHAKWLSAMGVDAILLDLTNGVPCSFFQAWQPYCGDQRTYREFQAIKANTANLYPAFSRLGTPLKIVPLLGGFEAGDFATDINGKSALEEELDYFSALINQYPGLTVQFLGKPLVVIYVGCAQPLDSDAIWRKANLVIAKYPSLTFRLMAADLDDQPPLWATPAGTAGLRQISLSNPFWSWVDRLNPAAGLLPSYLPGKSGPENLTASVATLSRQSVWGNAATGTYAPDDALSLGGGTFHEFINYAIQLNPTFLIVHQWNEYSENGWDTETDTDIEPSTFSGVEMMMRVQEEIGRFKTAVDLTRGRAPSFISFPPVRDTALGVSSLVIQGSATSGLPVDFSSLTPATCSISGNTVTLTGGGTCTILGFQAGSELYRAAPFVTRSFLVETPVMAASVFQKPALGVFRPRTASWYLNLSGTAQWSQGIDLAASFGLPADSQNVVVTGDWTGSGTTKVGVFRNGLWYLDLNGNGKWDGPDVDRLGHFGLPGDIPVVGDWDKSGRTKVGVFRNGMWYLDLTGYGQYAESTAKVASLGQAGDVPVVGDWDGSGTSKIGVFRNGTWLLDVNGNGQWDGPDVDIVGAFGLPGDVPVVGSWNGLPCYVTRGPATRACTRANIGVYRNGAWFLDLSGSAQWDNGNHIVGHFGTVNDVPVVGDWNGNGKSKVGVFRNGEWHLDLSGTAEWNANTDLVGNVGIAGDTPVVGYWK